MSNNKPVAPNNAVAQKTPVKPGGAVHGNGAKPLNGTALAGKVQAAQATPAKGEPAAPIEPSMWKRYSPHHEFPLSLVTTVVIYTFAAFVALVLGGIVLNLWGAGEPPEIENIEFAGGGGDPSGSRDSNVNNGPQENIDFNITDEQTDQPVVPTEVDLTATDAQPRLVEEAKSSKKAFTPNSWGRGGTGTGGGKGSGHGTGEGDGSGPGKQSKREKRKDRWVVNFNFSSGEDYLRRLNDLGAYLAFPEADKKFRMYDDLGKRPPSPRLGTVEDIKKWNRIYWRDTNLDSRDAIASALGMSTVPNYFWIFLPVELENELFEKEKAHRGLTEEQLIQRNLETIFSVERVGSKFSVKVIKQDRKKG